MPFRPASGSPRRRWPFRAERDCGPGSRRRSGLLAPPRSGLAPGDFTATRNERAKAARSAGGHELAERIRRLRRPTLAAWASNLLVREQPDEAERLLQLGGALRQAHQNLDGEQLRELSAQQRQVTFTLARQAGRLTAQAGQRISEDVQREVQETLHAVLADPDAAQQWAQGHLTKPLSAPVGFTALPQAPAERPAPRRGNRLSGRVADLDAARARREEEQERLQRAQQEAADAERQLKEQEEALAGARQERDRAEDEADVVLMYERVIREAQTPADIQSYLNDALLRQLWADLFLPLPVRSAWQSRFPEIAATAAAA